MNPDRATLNFLNSFPEEARKRGEMLQKDGAVTQIFGNHLFKPHQAVTAFGRELIWAIAHAARERD